MKEKILAMNIKKIVRWSTGYAVYVTKEAKALGWDDKTQIIMTAIEDSKGKAIVIRKAPISKK